MSFEHGAAFGIVYQTSYFGLVYRAALQPGETLLVHAAAGGVGLAAVQIGRALGARVLATAGSRRQARRRPPARRRSGLSTTRDPDWVEQVKAATGGRGADVIYDPVGGDVFDLSLKCIAFGGRLLVIGFASGTIPNVSGQPHPAEEHRGRRPALGRLPPARSRPDPGGDARLVRACTNAARCSR